MADRKDEKRCPFCGLEYSLRTLLMVDGKCVDVPCCVKKMNADSKKKLAAKGGG